MLWPEFEIAVTQGPEQAGWVDRKRFLRPKRRVNTLGNKHPGAAHPHPAFAVNRGEGRSPKMQGRKEGIKLGDSLTISKVTRSPSGREG